MGFIRKAIDRLTTTMSEAVIPESWYSAPPQADTLVHGNTLIAGLVFMIVSAVLTFALMYTYYTMWTYTTITVVSNSILPSPYSCKMLSGQPFTNRQFLFELPFNATTEGPSTFNWMTDWMYLVNGFVAFQNWASWPPAGAIFLPFYMNDVSQDHKSMLMYVTGPEYYGTHQDCLNAFFSACNSPNNVLDNFQIAYGATPNFPSPAGFPATTPLTDTFYFDQGLFFNNIYNNISDQQNIFAPAITFALNTSDPIYSSTCFYRAVLPAQWSGCNRALQNSYIPASSPIFNWNCNTSTAQQIFFVNSGYSYPLFAAKFMGTLVNKDMCMKTWESAFCQTPLVENNAAAFCQMFEHLPPYSCSKQSYKSVLEGFNLALALSTNVFSAIGIALGMVFSLTASRRAPLKSDQKLLQHDTFAQLDTS